MVASLWKKLRRRVGDFLVWPRSAAEYKRVIYLTANFYVIQGCLGCCGNLIWQLTLVWPKSVSEADSIIYFICAAVRQGKERNDCLQPKTWPDHLRGFSEWRAMSLLWVHDLQQWTGWLPHWVRQLGRRLQDGNVRIQRLSWIFGCLLLDRPQFAFGVCSYVGDWSSPAMSLDFVWFLIVHGDSFPPRPLWICPWFHVLFSVRWTIPSLQSR
jgi:hypothetical protein